jgi:23S rRNA pseudouridine1911/1915/1917 synthase
VDVVYEDKDIVVVNKPRGVVVAEDKEERSEGQKTASLTDSVHSYIVRKYPGAKAAFVRAMHRLDKETTGVVLFAKSKAGTRLADDIKNHRVERIYLAIVEGAVKGDDGTIKKLLAKGDFGHGKKVGVSTSGEEKPTVTHYHVIERYENAAILEVRLETGFTHQIRVHLASIGHPIIGDKVYNPHGTIKFSRQALHASEVKFTHPSSGKPIHLKAKTPDDMEELIDRLRSF